MVNKQETSRQLRKKNSVFHFYLEKSIIPGIINNAEKYFLSKYKYIMEQIDRIKRTTLTKIYTDHHVTTSTSTTTKELTELFIRSSIKNANYYHDCTLMNQNTIIGTIESFFIHSFIYHLLSWSYLYS